MNDAVGGGGGGLSVIRQITFEIICRNHTTKVTCWPCSIVKIHPQFVWGYKVPLAATNLIDCYRYARNVS